jgi:hypothetical protein
MKTQTKLNVMTGLLMTLGASIAMAHSPDLVNAALHDSFSDQAEVQQSYQSNDAVKGVARPEAPRNKDTEELPVDLGDELGNSSKMASRSRRAEPGDLKEQAIAAKLDRELKEVDQSVDAGRSHRNTQQN